MIRSSQVIIIVSLIFISVGLAACGGRPEGVANSNATNTAPRETSEPKTNGNAEELGMVVNFSLEPEDLVWKQDDAKKVLTAVFRLDAEGTKKLAEELSSGQNGKPYEVSTEDWFPPELIAQADAGGGSSVNGTAYPATMFYQGQYNEGTVTRVVGTDYFVLELHAK